MRCISCSGTSPSNIKGQVGWQQRKSHQQQLSDISIKFSIKSIMKFLTIVAIFLGVAGVSQAAAAGEAPSHHLIDRKYS